MNKGIKLSNGLFLLFLGSDDYLIDNRVFEDIFSTKIPNDYDFIYGNVYFGSESNIHAGKFNDFKIINMNICHQSIFYSKKCFETLGYYDLRFKIWADWYFNMKVFSEDKIRKIYVDRIISKFTFGGKSSVLVVDETFLSLKNEIVRSLFDNEMLNHFDKFESQVKDIENLNIWLKESNIKLNEAISTHQNHPLVKFDRNYLVPLRLKIKSLKNLKYKLK
jgi:Cft2 family RNA processing exonuclease